MGSLKIKTALVGAALLSAVALFCLSSREMTDGAEPAAEPSGSASIDGPKVRSAVAVGRCPDGSAITIEKLGERDACPGVPTPSGAAEKAPPAPPDTLIVAAMDGSVLAMGALLQDLHRCAAAKVPPEKDPSNRCAWIQDQAPQLIRQLEARVQLGDTQAQSELRRTLDAHAQYQSSTSRAVPDPGSPAEEAMAAAQDELDRARAVLAQLAEGDKPPPPVVDASMQGRPPLGSKSGMQ